MNRPKLLGVALALLTGALWGCSAPVGKFLAQNGTDMMTVVFLRTVVVCVIAGIWNILTDGFRGVRAKKEELPFLFLLGVMNTLFTAMGFLVSLKYLSVPVALLIHYLFPIATIAGEYFIFHQFPSVKKILAAVLVLLGLWIGMIQSGPAKGLEISPVGVLWGLLAVVGLAGQSLMGKMAAERHYNYKTLLLYSHVFGTLSIGLVKLFFDGMGDIFLLSFMDLFLISMIGVFAGVFAYAAYYISLRHISSSLASLLCTSEIVVGMTVTALVLLAPPSFFEMAGAGIIILAIGISIT